MLDDLKIIHTKDPQDALGYAEKQWQQLEHEFVLNGSIDSNMVENIVFSGMGGSALSALIFKSWPGVNVPFEISRDYKLPSYANQKSLVIVSSYSGNTEETISSLNDALERKAQIIVIAGGGKLLDIAKEKNLAFVVLPPAGQPRFAALYGLNALVSVLSASNIIDVSSLRELRECSDFLKKSCEEFIPTVAKENNIAKQYAYECIGNSPVIYAGVLFAAAYKWKISFNENAKNIAWCNAYPEFNHNEFLGWTSHPIEKPYRIFDLISTFDHPQVIKRFKVSDRLLSGRRPTAIEVNAKGDSLLRQLLYTIALGDFVSMYTAILNGVNPTPVDIIEKLKKELT
jgi:glucose/mannose-6-phosphate isomerase